MRSFSGSASAVIELRNETGQPTLPTSPWPRPHRETSEAQRHTLLDNYDWEASMLHILDPENVFEGIRSMANQETAIPHPVAAAASHFMAIHEVLDVRLSLDGHEGVLHVFVHMPKYNDQLMEALVDVEMRVEEELERYGYSFEFRYYPSPMVDVSEVGLGRLPSVTGF